jgi:hypothetical protein
VNEHDSIHAAALELAAALEDRLRRLEPARDLFFDADRLVQLVRQLALIEAERR